MKIHFLLLGLVFIISCKSEEKPTEVIIEKLEIQYQTLKIEDLNLTMDYPKSWSQIDMDSRTLFTAAEDDTTQANIYRENLVLYRILSKDMEIDSVLGIAKVSMQTQYPEATNIETVKGVNDNNLSYGLLSVSMERNGVNLKSETYYFLYGEEYYILNLGYDQKDSQLHRQICDHIFNSLKIEQSI